MAEVCASNSGGPIGEQFREETYDKMMNIPDWVEIQKGEVLKTFEIETSKSPGVSTKWEISFEWFPEVKNYCVNFLLVEEKGFPEGKVDATAMCTLLNDNNVASNELTSAKGLRLGERMSTQSCLKLSTTPLKEPSVPVPVGEVGTLRVQLSIMEPISCVDLQMKRFQKISLPQIQENYTGHIRDKDTADLKIITSDGKELLAHKTILKAQCPVFDAMFRSDLSENQSGVVNVKDVTGKTMEVFLHLFYSAELPPSWKDPDTVVELTSSAGKYQLTNLLKLLDETLGIRDELDASHVDVQLLDLAQKLELKVAEKDLMNRIKNSVNQMNSGAEFFALSGFDKE